MAFFWSEIGTSSSRIKAISGMIHAFPLNIMIHLSSNSLLLENNIPGYCQILQPTPPFLIKIAFILWKT